MWTRLRASVSRLRFAWIRRRLDADARHEMDAHLDLLTDRYIGLGMSADEAYTAARRQFGNPAVITFCSWSAFSAGRRLTIPGPNSPPAPSAPWHRAQRLSK